MSHPETATSSNYDAIRAAIERELEEHKEALESHGEKLTSVSVRIFLDRETGLPVDAVFQMETKTQIGQRSRGVQRFNGPSMREWEKRR